eukprot:331768-Hanusia_phi.AAC.10
MAFWDKIDDTLMMSSTCHHAHLRTLINPIRQHLDYGLHDDTHILTRSVFRPQSTIASKLLTSFQVSMV